MEKLPGPLLLLQQIIYTLETGSSMRKCLFEYIKIEKNEFKNQLEIWINLVDRGQSTDFFLISIKSPDRQQLFIILEQGLKGHSILSSLKQIETEFFEKCDEQIDAYLTLLPFKMLIPLMCFILPAFLIMIAGPSFMKLAELLK